MNDEQLLQEIGKGSKACFRELFEKFAPPLMGFLRRFGGERCDTEELIQEIMLRIWSKAPLFDAAKGKAKPWIYGMASRLAINWRESRAGKARKTEVLTTEFPEVPVIESDHPAELKLEREQDSRRLRSALDRLPEEFRLAVTLRHLENLSVEEIAEVMECPPGTVKSRIFYGLKKLREIMRTEEAHERQNSV